MHTVDEIGFRERVDISNVQVTKIGVNDQTKPHDIHLLARQDARKDRYSDKRQPALW